LPRPPHGAEREPAESDSRATSLTEGATLLVEPDVIEHEVGVPVEDEIFHVGPARVRLNLIEERDYGRLLHDVPLGLLVHLLPLGPVHLLSGVVQELVKDRVLEVPEVPPPDVLGMELEREDVRVGATP